MRRANARLDNVNKFPIRSDDWAAAVNASQDAVSAAGLNIGSARMALFAFLGLRADDAQLPGGPPKAHRARGQSLFELHAHAGAALGVARRYSDSFLDADAEQKPFTLHQQLLTNAQVIISWFDQRNLDIPPPFLRADSRSGLATRASNKYFWTVMKSLVLTPHT